MKKITVYLITLLIVCLLAMGIHKIASVARNTNPPFRMFFTKGDLPSPKKGKINKVSGTQIVCLGSSEFDHGKNTPYHPYKLFLGTDIQPITIGTAYTQSLYQCIALSSMERNMDNRRVVLILSPQWFDKLGVKSDTYTSRFSEADYLYMLLNPNVPYNDKVYMAKRTRSLLKNDSASKRRVQEYNSALLTAKPYYVDVIKYRVLAYTMAMSESTSVWTARNASAAVFAPEWWKVDAKKINWQSLMKQAEVEGSKVSKKEHFYIKEDIYNSYYAHRIGGFKNSDRNMEYVSSPEYGDFQQFLSLCKALKIEPLLIMLPFNGFWTDYTGFPKERRAEYYNKIRTIAKANNLQLVDLSYAEYMPHFNEDTLHPSYKGWVIINRAIYDFVKQKVDSPKQMNTKNLKPTELIKQTKPVTPKSPGKPTIPLKTNEPFKNTDIGKLSAIEEVICYLNTR